MKHRPIAPLAALASLLTGTPAGGGPLHSGDELILGLAGHDFAAEVA